VRARRILVCDDEPQILRALRVILHEAGYEVDVAATLAEALDAAALQPPDGAIVDLVLPDGSGLDLCVELRSWSTMPILVVSAIDEEAQKVKALETGADDYIVKPFTARELLARLEARFRRVTAETAEASLVVGGLEIDFAAHRVCCHGRYVKLTPTEFALLSVLARSRGLVMTSGALLAEVWGPAHPGDAPLLRAHIANLRHKIEDDAPHWRYIKTEPGVGYRFGD
jgi:two-component system, OmpR family, KDP operon response regulator KdpE